MHYALTWESNNHNSDNNRIYENVHNSLLLDFIQCQFKPVYTLTNCFLKENFNIVFSFMKRITEWSLPFRYFDNNFICIYYLQCMLYVPPTWIHWCDNSVLCHRVYLFWSPLATKIIIKNFYGVLLIMK